MATDTEKSDVVEVSDALQHIADDFKLTAVRRGISLDYSFSPVKLEVNVSQRLIHMLLENLLEFCFAQTQQNRWIMIETSHGDDVGAATPGGTELSVRYRGYTLSPELVSSLNNSGSLDLAQLYNATTGIGPQLPLVHRITAVLGGNFELQSTGLQEYRIALRLPTGKKTEEESVRILLLEDNRINQLVMKRSLEQKSHVDTASNIREARDLLQKYQYSLLVLDIHLGKGHSGADLLQEIRTGGGNNHAVPAVAITGYTRQHDLETLRQCGFNEIVTKPISPVKLLQLVEDKLFQYRID